jgi:hypothetical protein
VRFYVYDDPKFLYSGYRPVRAEDISDDLLERIAAAVDAAIGSAGRMQARAEVAAILRGEV